MIVAEYVINRLVQEGIKDVFMVSGGGGMFLIDELGKRKDISYTCNHHEQASSMCAEAYYRVSGKPGVALVTTGPAGTNAITGLMCAWNDSIPMIVISGQAKSSALIADSGLRQRGVHEANIVGMVKDVTKYAVTVMAANEIGYHLDKAIYLCKNGRPGPVWIDIPLDIQSASIDLEKLKKFDPKVEYPHINPDPNPIDIDILMDLLTKAQRPIILGGHGIKLAAMQDAFRELITSSRIPVALTKNAFDLLEWDCELLAGQVGTYGQRSGNFALQNADLVVCLGTRLCYPVVGYETELFAREAKIVLVELDEAQIRHPLVRIDLSIKAHLGLFIPELLHRTSTEKITNYDNWLAKIAHWKSIFPNVTKEQRDRSDYIDTYNFFEVLSEEMGADQILVWDQGATFYCSTVAFKLKKGQLAFSNGGFTPMGYGLPAAIGVAVAKPGTTVVCVHGDGGLQMNVQELQTIKHNKLPIKIFVFDNKGYLSIKQTQQAYFAGHLVGSDPTSGLSCPDAESIGAAYGIESTTICSNQNLRLDIRRALSLSGPTLVNVITDPFQVIQPRVTSSRQPDGSMRSMPLEDMWPLLDREFFHREMIVKPVN